MRILLIIMLGLWAVPALAQDLVIQSDCRALPQADKQAADYKPGVDVKGEKVAPADLEPSVGQPLDYPIEIPIEIDALRSLDLDVSADAKADSSVVHVTLYEDGHLEYNGQDISSIARHQCVKDLQLIELEPPEDEEAAAGQKAASAVPSKAAPDPGRENLDKIINQVTKDQSKNEQAE